MAIETWIEEHFGNRYEVREFDGGGDIYHKNCRCEREGIECPTEKFKFAVKPVGEHRPLPLGWTNGEWSFLVEAPDDFDWTWEENQLLRVLVSPEKAMLLVSEKSDLFPFSTDIKECYWWGVGETAVEAVENLESKDYKFGSLLWSPAGEGDIVVKHKDDKRPLPVTILQHGHGGMSDGKIYENYGWGTGYSRAEAIEDLKRREKEWCEE